MRFYVSVLLICIAALMLRALWNIWWLYFAVAVPSLVLLAVLFSRDRARRESTDSPGR